MSLSQNIIFFIKTYLIFIILAIYVILWINKMLYEIRIFLLDLRGLKQRGKSEVAAMRTKMIREGTQRYAPQIADGIIQAAQSHVNEETLRRKLKFKHDLVNSFFTAITQFFGK